MKKTNNYGNRLTVRQVGEIKYLLANGDYKSFRNLGKIYGCSDVNIGKIAKGERWINVEPRKPE